MAVIDDYRVKLDGPEAHRLADMEGVHFDLRITSGTVAHLKRHREKKNPDWVILDALADSALIRYGRCYSGVRHAFRIPTEWIEALPSSLQQAHQYFRDLRDKHIAHSVNDWELNTPVAHAREDRDTGKLTVYQVRVDIQRIVPLGSEIDTLGLLAKTLADRLDGEILQLRAQLLKRAKNIPEDELRRLFQQDRPDLPGQRKVGERRPR